MISTTDISGYVADLLRDAIPSDTTFDVSSPIDGSLIASVPDCGEAQARQALDKSEQAFEAWKRTTAYERAAVMKRWHALIVEHEVELAYLMTLEMGKPINESISEVRYGNSMVEWYAEEAKRVGGESIPSQHPRKRLHTLKQPTGIVYAITPWNFPIAIVLRKLAPALAAGCTVILKPAEQTPLSSLALAKLWREAGGSPDALLVLPALDPRPVSQVLLADMRVRVLTFTGSTAVGMLLYQQSARTMKKVALELGGHAPFLIFDDADIDLAIQDVVACKFRNSGQTCVCTNRIYVQEAIADEFTRRFADAVGGLRVGNPLDTTTQVGPLIDRQGYAKVQSHLEDAVSKGATVISGGQALQGLYYQPTVLTHITGDMLLMQEETFGPIAPIITFGSDDEGIRLANRSDYGLAAYVWTNDLNRAQRASEELEFGIIGLNDGTPSTAQAPFGGMKLSGIGREGGHWGIEEFLDIKYVSVGLK